MHLSRRQMIFFTAVALCGQVMGGVRRMARIRLKHTNLREMSMNAPIACCVQHPTQEIIPFHKNNQPNVVTIRTTCQ
jgi:hypothetical protein